MLKAHVYLRYHTNSLQKPCKVEQHYCSHIAEVGGFCLLPPSVLIFGGKNDTLQGRQRVPNSMFFLEGRGRRALKY